jgi:hypothetical protein
MLWMAKHLTFPIQSYEPTLQGQTYGELTINMRLLQRFTTHLLLPPYWDNLPRSVKNTQCNSSL